MRFGGMAPVTDGAEGPQPPAWPRARLRSTIGAPSAGLSLGGLRARRARLRFTRRRQKWRGHGIRARVLVCSTAKEVNARSAVINRSVRPPFVFLHCALRERQRKFRGAWTRPGGAIANVANSAVVPLTTRSRRQV